MAYSARLVHHSAVFQVTCVYVGKGDGDAAWTRFLEQVDSAAEGGLRPEDFVIFVRRLLRQNDLREIKA